MRQNRALEERMRELESDKSQLETLRYRLVKTQGRADEKAAEAARLKDEATALEKIDHFPHLAGGGTGTRRSPLAGESSCYRRR